MAEGHIGEELPILYLPQGQAPNDLLVPSVTSFSILDPSLNNAVTGPEP